MIIPDGKGQMQEQIDMSKTTPLKCDACGGQTFKQTLLLRKMSALVSPNGQEAIIPVGVFACEKCGNVNKEFEDVGGIG
tara:strand:+ start:220 stop:456 length:237 start_codon:yes stop_codon:yes gene_type:complete